MFTALSSMLEAAVSVGVDTAAGLLFEAEANPAALESLRQSGKDLTEPDELREAAETVCQAVEDNELRRQLFTADGTEADPFFMDLLLRFICSSDVVRCQIISIRPCARLRPCHLPLVTHSHKGLLCTGDSYLGYPSVSRGNRRYEWNALSYTSCDCRVTHELAASTRDTRAERESPSATMGRPSSGTDDI